MRSLASFGSSGRLDNSASGFAIKRIPLATNFTYNQRESEKKESLKNKIEKIENFILNPIENLKFVLKHLALVNKTVLFVIVMVPYRKTKHTFGLQQSANVKILIYY